MKSLGGGGQLVSGAGLTPEECRGYSLSQPISTLVTGIESYENLMQDVEIARGFRPLSAIEQQSLLDRTQDHAADGRFEWFKTTQYYDSQLHRDQHGFPPIGHVAQDHAAE